MQIYSTKSKLKRHIDYFTTKTSLSVKSLKEYKIDMYLSIFMTISFAGIYFLFYYVFFSNFELVTWTTKEFILFTLILWVGTMTGISFSLRGIAKTLLTGKLNTYLCIPINSYYSSTLENFVGRNIFTLLLNLTAYIVLLIVFQYNLINSINSLIVLFIGSFSFTIFTNFILVFSFFAKEISFLYDILFKHIIYLNEKFTPVVFDGNILKNFFYILPSAFYGYFTIEALLGNTTILLKYLPYFIIINIILFIITYLIWKQGLKSYEAFG